MPSYTKNLKIRLLEGSDRFVDDTFNTILNDMDSKLVGVSHLTSGAHFTVWDKGTAYVVGDVVRTPYLKSGQYMECVVSGTSSSSVPTYNVDGTKFTDGSVEWVIRTLSSSANNVVSIWLSGAVYSIGSLVLYDNTLYRAKTPHTSTSFSVDIGKWQEVYASVRIWKAGVFYDIDDSVIYNDILYRCISANSSPKFTYSEWVMVNDLSTIGAWISGQNYYLNQLVVNEGLLYRATVSHVSSSTFSTDYLDNKWLALDANVRIWKSGIEYFSGDVVFFNNTCYICKSQHTSSISFKQDIANWDLLIRNSAYLHSWVSNEFYDVGQVVVYKGNIFRCITSNNDVTFNNSNWELLVQFLNEWQTSTTYSVGALVIYDSVIYQCNTLHTSHASSFDNDRSNWNEISKTTVNDWKSNFLYTLGDMCSYNQKIFICTVSHTSGTSFSDANFKELSPNYLYSWASGVNYRFQDVVTYNHIMYRCLANHKSSSNFSTDSAFWESLVTITPWISGWSYVAGDCVINDSDSYIYKCVSNHVSSSSFSSDEFSNWIKFGANNILLSWSPGVVYDVGQIIHINKTLYRANVRHVSSTTFLADINRWELVYANISTYSSGVDYLVDSLVIYGHTLYRCTVAHTSVSPVLNTSNWEVIGGSLISVWRSNITYVVNDCVVFEDFLYRCISNHTSSTRFDATKWINLSRATINNWVKNYRYERNQVVFYNNCLYRCIVPTNGDATFKPKSWELLCCKNPDLVVSRWEANKEYVRGVIVVYNNELYWCLSDHTSAGVFANDLAYDKWQLLTGGSSGGGSGISYTQNTLMDVLAPKTFEFDIAETTDFNLAPVEVLKFKAGNSDVVQDVLTFDISDGTMFSVDGISSKNSPYALYKNGRLYLATEYTYKHGSAVGCGSGYVTISNEIDLSNFKSVDSVEVV